MPFIRRAIALATASVRANLLPGLFLQALMVVFAVTYLTHGGTQAFLGRVADYKEQTGYAFAFFSYIFAGAFLPECMRVIFFQSGRVHRLNLWLFLTAAPLWGLVGMLVDGFYRLQTSWFGSGNDWQTILSKLLVDQFIFAPFLCNLLIVCYFLWRDCGYNRTVLPLIFCRSFIPERLLPVQMAGWLIWIPGVILVYFMPPLLQLPVAVTIQIFWVLTLTTVSAKSKKPAAPECPQVPPKSETP